MDAINQEILKQLQEYAQKYFAAIIEANSKDGECNLKPGKYSAKDLIDNFKSPCGIYIYPAGEEYEGKITAAAGTFKCCFPYRRIFAILADWETMSHAGKQKAIFEIGEVEEKSAKVLINEKSELGLFKTKGMKVQHIAGNWWMPRRLPKSGDVELFYELNGVMFVPGLRFDVERIAKHRKDVVNRCSELGDEQIIKLFLSYLGKHKGNFYCEYFEEVAKRVNLDTTSEEATVTMAAAKEEQRKHEEEQARELAEQKARGRGTPQHMELEEQTKREAAEHLAKAKEKFIAGKMISREDFERVAGSVGYKINIRTLGTLRKRITWIEVAKDGTPTVYGTKKRAGLDGTFEVIREVYALVKTQSEETAKQAAETPEIPQASNYTAEPEKRDTEPQNEPKQVVWIFRTTEPGTCKNFLIVANVPRCSTAYHFVDVRKMVYTPPGCSPPDRHPPIRGDCKPAILTKQTTRINKPQRLNLRL